MEFKNHFLNTIIYGCITDTEFAKQIRHSFPLDAYRSVVRTKIADLIYEFIDKHGEAPNEHFYDIFQDFIVTIPENRQELYFKLIDDIRRIEHINKDYIISKIFQAIRHIRLEEATVEMARLVKEKRYDDAERIFLNAIKDPQVHIFKYIDYFEDTSDLLERVTENPFMMQTMIPHIDEIIGGIRKEEVVVWLGTPKTGKTYGLISMAHAALLQGLTVVFISLELHRHRIASRLDQTAGFMVGAVRPKEIMTYSDGIWAKRRRSDLYSIFDIEEVQKVRKALRRHRGRLIIASAPGGTKNFRDIELFLDELETAKGIMPNVVIVDYLRNMKGTAPNQSRKDKIGENCLGLVSIAGERQCIIHTAQQGNRKAMTSPVLRPEMIADDIDPIGYVDIVPAICQTEEEENRNQARIYLAIVREGVKGAQIRVTRDLSIGQFWLDSELVTREDWE